MKNHIRLACESVGGKTAMANAVGVSRQTIHKWLESGRPMAEKVLLIEALTQGRVTRYQLRPDIYGAPPKQAQLIQVKPLN